jgi:hypothetical protein
MATPLGNCQIVTSTIFVFDSVASQKASDNVYVNKKGDLTSSLAGRLAPGVNHDVKLVFKTDYERMQYLLGLYGRTSQGLR